MRLRVQPLGEEHDRSAFNCGHASIDNFLKNIAQQRQRRKIGTTFVAADADADPHRIVGYYTVLPHQFRGTELPDPYRKGTRIGSIYAVPGALLAQLGIDLEFQGKWIGKSLLTHALTRIASFAQEWGCAAVVTDPIDERARAFYTAFDFQPLNDGSSRMILAISTILEALKQPR